MTRYEATVVFITVLVVLSGAGMFGVGLALGNEKLLSHEDAPAPSLFGLLPVEQHTGVLPPKRKTLDAFPDAGATWRDRFPRIETVPVGSFVAYYFNTEDSTKWKTLKLHPAASVDLNFAWAFDTVLGKESGIGIARSSESVQSESFGAYWIGSFTIPTETKLDLHVTQSWAHTRVILDGREVYNKENQDVGEPILLLLSAGTHTMEVEYTNNWHTTSISVNLLDGAFAPLSQDEIARRLPAGAEQWTAAVYESGAQDKRIVLKSAPGAQGPVVLNLSSYDSVNWDLSGMNTPIAAVVVSGFSSGSRVLQVPTGVAVYYSTASWHENSNYEDRAHYGFATGYAPRELVFPTTK
jgi:hypothetical protein